MTALPDRALSLSWPWPHFMLALPESIRKPIENRKPGFSHKSFRGESWVHVTPPKSQAAFSASCHFALARGVPPELLAKFADFPGLGIMGRWTITGVLPVPAPSELPDGWRMVGQFAFTVADARLVPFVACKGALGFWRVPPAVLEQLASS